ncbi:4'-phosphopantetheinyl transferase superfamily protein [Lichenihabitans sp. PAMC28606]|uniref:4'-phosphopantetheinyl transferase family protein n=1 Tax=Lichenihabitans sp. PAMC28606 TaxID=2880932 RepID=UPI001D0BC4B8|nr:4'-phosphopantetheinyl transferase superfamily protein [Lichenihabitans sp. PAMC28606]UDL96129.1 4'-phosphopantetheinyl transferase superfamily protein [Lichenihabitans sp. PAMC28606]
MIESLRLSSGQVDVWLVDPASVGEADLLRGEPLLDAVERSRWQALSLAVQRRDFLLGRILLRTTLSLYAAVPPEAWRFGIGQHGRPFVVQPAFGPPLGFTLSRTEGLLALAVASGPEVGVDVEVMRPDIDALTVAKAFFMPTEIADLAQGPKTSLIERFTTIWTLKEAYIKARGLGVTIPLDGFRFDLAGDTPRIAFDAPCPDDTERWRFHAEAPTPHHRLAVAYATPHRLDVRLRWVDAFQC